MDDQPGEPSVARDRAATGAVTGVDGCAGGWIAVTLACMSPSAPLRALARAGTNACGHPAGLGPVAAQETGIAVETARSFSVSVATAARLDGLTLAGVTGIDMPLGLLGAGWRDADLLARRALGRRGVTVFAIPPRAVWECETYAEANRACRDQAGRGLSVQAWGLRGKITEADEFRRRAASSPSPVRLYEVHPELSFTAMAGAPLGDSKHTGAGLAIRRGLLARAGITLPPKVAGAAENDLLDAAAVAWSARRIAAGRATVLANPAQRADDGTEIAIRY